MRRKLWQFSHAIFCWLFADLRNYFAVEEERIMIRSMKDYEVHSELHLRAACPEQSSAMW